MKKILLFIFVSLFAININATDYKYFNINIPDDFELKEQKDNIYEWVLKENNHNTLVITIAGNDGNKNNISKYTDENIQKYKEYIQNEYDKALKEYNLKIEINNLKKEKVNDMDALVYDITWPTKDSIGYNTYQKGITFTTSKYVYVYVWTQDTPIDVNNETYKNILNSLKLNDEVIKDKGLLNTERKRIIFVGTIAGIIGYIISALKRRKVKKV